MHGDKLLLMWMNRGVKQAYLHGIFPDLVGKGSLQMKSGRVVKGNETDEKQQKAQKLGACLPVHNLVD